MEEIDSTGTQEASFSERSREKEELHKAVMALFEEDPRPLNSEEQRQKDTAALDMLRAAASYHEWRVVNEKPVTSEADERYEIVTRRILTLEQQLKP